MIRFALIVASTLGFVLTAALGNFMAPLLQELERFRPQEQQEPQTPVQSRVPALGGLCLMVSILAAVGVGWTAACIAQPRAGQREPADDPAADRAARCTGFRGHRAGG